MNISLSMDMDRVFTSLKRSILKHKTLIILCVCAERIYVDSIFKHSFCIYFQNDENMT